MITTGIGSLPFVDIEKAIEVCQKFDIPYWPQLPRKTFLENMYIQYADGLPFSEIDDEKKSLYFRLEGMDESVLEKFYEKIISEDHEYFAISRERASGLYAVLEKPLSKKIIKGQIVGPVSFGLTVTDENKRAVFYHEIFKEILVKAIALKTRWMMKKLGSVYENVYLFVDEPYLSQIGSAFVSLDPEEVKAFLSEIFAEINKAGVSGIHCCGETDWDILLDLDFKILSFDAFNYSLVPFAKKLKSFLERGGKILFGIVPAEKVVSTVTTKDLKEKFESHIKELTKAGIEKELLLKNTMLSPSCGLASLTEEQAIYAVNLLNELKQEIEE